MAEITFVFIASPRRNNILSRTIGADDYFGSARNRIPHIKLSGRLTVTGHLRLLVHIGTWYVRNCRRKMRRMSGYIIFKTMLLFRSTITLYTRLAGLLLWHCRKTSLFRSRSCVCVCSHCLGRCPWHIRLSRTFSRLTRYLCKFECNIPNTYQYPY